MKEAKSEQEAKRQKKEGKQHKVVTLALHSARRANARTDARTLHAKSRQAATAMLVQ